MANINVTYTENTITVDEVTSNVTVTETVNTVNVAEGVGLDIQGVRASLGNIAPVLYNTTTGIISLDSEAVFSNTIANAWLTTKTTTDLAEGTNLYFTAARARGNVSATTATGITYNSGTGVFSLASIPNSSLTNTTVTINGKSVALGSSNTLTTSDIGEGTNLYFTAARARGNVSATDAGGMGAFSYSSGTGVFTYTGPSDSEVRAVISAANTTTGHGNISYSTSTGVITYNRVTPANILSEITAGNVKLKQYSETVFNAGNQFGNVTLNVANGSIQQLNLVGNVTGLAFTNITAGSTVSLILRQDAIGFRRLNTTLFASNWTTWDFVGDHTTLTIDPLAYDILTVTYDGTNYFASLVNFDQPVIQNSQLANSNVIVNGVTIALGSSGNIDTFNSNVTVNGNLNVTGNLNYQNVTDLYVTDQKITLNSNAATNANVEIISNRPTATSVMLKWNEPSTRWEFTNDGTTYYAIATSTTDLAEGSNLWFTTARANSAIDNRLVGGTGISYTAGTVALDFSEFNTGNITEGTNLYFTTARANTAIDDYVLGSENIDVTSGVISLSNALGNVNSITSSASTNLTLNTNNKLVVTQNFKGRAVAASANVEHDGYGFFRSGKTFTPVTSYTGNANIENFIFATGNTTAGSNAITGVSLVEWFNEVTPASLSNVAVNSVFSLNQNNPYPFSYGARVTSVDAANSTIYMNQAAGFTQDLTKGTLFFFLQPALLDTQTGQALRLVSQFDANVSPRSKTVLQTSDVMFPGRYGYPQSGFAISDFDVFTAGVAGDYTLGDSSTMMVGRNKLTAPTTVLTAPRGMIVGNNADLTNRAENDTISSFGVNVLWDGTDTSYVNTTSGSLTGPLTQILVKNYTDNNLQGFSTNRSFFGPRLFFTAAEGNALEPYTVTYPLNNLELGRIAFWCASQTQPSPGSGVPPAFISVVTNRDMTGSHNGGVGMYLSASPNTDAGRRGLFAAHQLGKTLIASGNATTTGASEPITFAPMWTSVAQSATGGSNAVAQFNNTFGATNYQWANVNYDNASGKTGSRLSVTNGASTVSARNGNLVIAIDRNDNGAGFGSKEWAFKLRNGQTDLVLTEDDVIRTTFAGANITTAGNITASTFIGNLSGSTATLSGNADVTGNINLGTNATINYDSVFGEFYNTSNVTAAAADTVYALEWPNVHVNTNRVTVSSNSQINIGQEGNYKFMVELQAVNTDNALRTAFLWLAKNGTDIADTAVKIGLRPATSGTTHQLITKMWLAENLVAGDYVEVRFAVDNTSGISLEATAAQASPYARPAIPSAVITITPVGV